EFYSEPAKTSSVKNPVEFVVSAIRASKASTNYTQIPLMLEEMGMELFNPPSVDGWSNGLRGLSTGTFLSRFDSAQGFGAGRDGRIIKISPKRLFDDDAPDAA